MTPAGVVRSAPELQGWAGLAESRRADELLEVLADRLDTLDPHTRSHIVRVCGDTLGRPMDQPAVRRTRR